MEILKKLLWKFTAFMYGRNGIDQLYIGSGILIILLAFLQIFVQSTLLNILSLALIIWSLYRFFSKNIRARRAENQKFMQLVTWAQGKLNRPMRRVKDIKTHRYRTCPNCETTLRLPRKRGKHKVRCPRCKELVEVKILI